MQDLMKSKNIRSTVIDGKSFALLPDCVARTIIIGGISYAILPDKQTCDILGVTSFSMANQLDIFESCSIYCDDVVILLTRATKDLLVSSDGFLYRAHSPLKLGITFD